MDISKEDSEMSEIPPLEILPDGPGILRLAELPTDIVQKDAEAPVSGSSGESPIPLENGSVESEEPTEVFEEPKGSCIRLEK